METTGKTTKYPNLMAPMKKGETRNPHGRPKGQRNYATIYREALIKIGQSQGKTPEEIENELHKSGLSKALKGDYKFYQDTLDRLHGKPIAPVSGEVDHQVTIHIKQY